MAIRSVINVATTPHYMRGQERLYKSIHENSPGVGFDVRKYSQEPTMSCPPHATVPYAFKAYALEIARRDGMETLLWCDSSIVCLRDLTPLFERIERDGYWIANNGWTNAQWTADSAYAALFPEHVYPNGDVCWEDARGYNRAIPHVVATAFGLSMRHETGRAILAEYFRLASETKAFCGPWKNTPETPCGSPECLGHRHDQTALSVIAWRMGCKLTSCPEIFSYWEGRNESTILAAKGIN